MNLEVIAVDFKYNCRRDIENTSSFISGLRSGNYESEAISDYMSEVHATFGHIYARTGTNHP